MLDLTTLAVFLVVLLLGYWLLKKKDTTNYPPGPGLGEACKLLFRTIKPEKLIMQWWRQYGDIMSIKMIGTGDLVVFVFGLDLWKETFLHAADVTSNRPSNLWLFNKVSKKKGILFNPTTWRATRRFALHSMRDFGLGKHSLDERLKEEAAGLVDAFRRRAGRAFDPREDLTKTVANIICSITFGKRYSRDDEEFDAVLHKLEDYFSSGINESILNNFPFLRHFSFLHKKLSVDYYLKPLNAMKQFIYKEIDIHRETYDPENMRDLVDLYIQAEKTGFKDIKDMDEEQLFQTILDLFMAGTETTTNTLRWILMYLINHEGVQEKCRQEIYREVGRDRLPDYRDRNKFPYVMATIQEAIRLKTVALGTLPHIADETLELGGYTVPAGSMLVGMTTGLMFEPKLWGDDVEDFRPDRWLNEDGELRTVPEFIPFTIGRRACPGEQLARSELFVNTVALLQSFSFTAEDPEQPPRVEGVARLSYVPHPFKIVPIPAE